MFYVPSSFPLGTVENQCVEGSDSKRYYRKLIVILVRQGFVKKYNIVGVSYRALPPSIFLYGESAPPRGRLITRSRENGYNFGFIDQRDNQKILRQDLFIQYLFNKDMFRISTNFIGISFRHWFREGNGGRIQGPTGTVDITTGT